MYNKKLHSHDSCSTLRTISQCTGICRILKRCATKRPPQLQGFPLSLENDLNLIRSFEFRGIQYTEHKISPVISSIQSILVQPPRSTLPGFQLQGLLDWFEALKNPSTPTFRKELERKTWKGKQDPLLFVSILPSCLVRFIDSSC